jgi:hypothetical protein
MPYGETKETTMKRSVFPLIVVVLLPGFAFAQVNLDSMHEHMGAVEFMVGEWAGEGWVATGQDGPQKISSHETVEARLDGLVLVIEGVSESLEEATLGEKVHHAVGVLSWNEGEGVYGLRSHLANGRTGDFKGRIVDGAFFVGDGGPWQVHPLLDYDRRPRGLERGRRELDRWRHLAKVL